MDLDQFKWTREPVFVLGIWLKCKKRESLNV